MNSSKRRKSSRIELFFSAPWWSRVPLFNVRQYPNSFEERLVFWSSAVVYSTVYIFIIAFAIVIFSHSLYGWTGLRDYFITTLYDIFFRHPVVIFVLVAIQVVLVYIQSLRTRLPGHIPVSRGRVFIRSGVIVSLIYALQYIARGSRNIEPNVLPTVIASFIVLCVVQLVVDRLLRKT